MDATASAPSEPNFTEARRSMPLTLKQLAYRLEMPERTVTNRAERGQIPGAVKTGTGTRTRWSFPEEAASLKGTLQPPREVRNAGTTPCKHCGAIFTTGANYVAHRKTVTINNRPTAACMDEREMTLCGLTRDSKGRWRRAPQRTRLLPGQRPQQTEAE